MQLIHTFLQLHRKCVSSLSYLPSLFTPHTHAHSSPSPHAPPLWSCHLSAPAQSLLRPTAHLPPAPLTAPVANANTHTHPHPLRHTQGCVGPHLPWCTCRRRNVVTHICMKICLCLLYVGISYHVCVRLFL